MRIAHTGLRDVALSSTDKFANRSDRDVGLGERESNIKTIKNGVMKKRATTTKQPPHYLPHQSTKQPPHYLPHQSTEAWHTMVVGAVNQQAANAHLAHFASSFVLPPKAK
jgi:hypothetical protein